MTERYSTPRFNLRPIVDDDLDALFENFSDHALMRYYDGTPLPDMDAVRELVATWRRRERKGTGMRWAIALKGSDRLIGSCGLHDIDMRARCAEIGCEVARSHWGCGVMGELAPVVGRYAFEVRELKRLDAYIAPGNRASLALAESLGFRRRRVLSKRTIINGRRSDMFLYSISRARYRVLTHPGLAASLAELPVRLRESAASAFHQLAAPLLPRLR